MLTFTALDFETANSSRASVCSLGMVKVVNGEIVDEWYHLMKPPVGHDYFDPFNTSIHGIRSSDVVAAERFNKLWVNAEEFYKGTPLMAHNAGFDMSVIRAACRESYLPQPTYTYGCTLVLSRKALVLPSYRLPEVASALGIRFNDHHKALADAKGCAEIALALAERNNAETLEELAQRLQVNLGRQDATTWVGCKSRKR